VLPLQWVRLTKTVQTVRLGREFVSVFMWLHDLSLCSCMFCFTLCALSHFPSNLNEPPSSFLLSLHYCGLESGSIPFRVIVNKKQCETRGLFMPLVTHYWIGDLQHSQGVSASEMTYSILCRVGVKLYSITHPSLLLLLAMLWIITGLWPNAFSNGWAMLPTAS